MIYDTNNRQHISLSQTAYSILETDGFEYGLSFAGIINRVLSNYMEDADAAIENALHRYRITLEEQLSDIPINETKRQIIDQLVTARCEMLKNTVSKYPNSHSLKIRVSKDNNDAVYGWKDEGGYYKGNRAGFLKAVIEEYARKPPLEREKIVLKGFIDELQNNIDKQTALVVTNQWGNRFELKPYSIEPDPGHNYLYLIGLSRKAGSDDEFRLYPFRISRLIKHRSIRTLSGRLTKEEIKEIKKKLHSEWIQFLGEEEETIEVKLTEAGVQLYKSQAHLRPMYMDKTHQDDGTYIFTFLCTPMQAEYYFFKFGADAEIRKPIKLRNLFKEKYIMASDKYQNCKDGK